jgi:hypothetical protein
MAFGDLRGTFVANGSSVTNPSVATGSVAVSVADLVYVQFVQQTALTATAVTDDLGNTYTALNAGTDAGAVTCRTFYSYVTVAGTLTTLNVAATASSNNFVIVAVVIEGAFDATPLDANPANITSDITSLLTCPATGTLAQADEVIIAWMARNSADATSVQSPLLAGATQATGALARGTIGRQTVTATTSVSPEFTTAVNPTECILGTNSFKKAAGTSPISGATTLVYSIAGALGGSGALSAATGLTFAPSASLSATGALTGAATVTFAPTASLGQIGVLAGATTLTFSPSADIAGSGALSGPLTLTFTPTAAISADGSLVGAATLAFAPSADLAGSGSLSGSVAVTFASAATVDAVGELAGVSALAFEPSGNLTGDDPEGQILGATGLSFSPTGALLGSAALSGAAGLIFVPTGTLGGSGAIEGTASFAFSASAALGVLGEITGEGSGQVLLTGSGVGQSGEDVSVVYGGFSGGIVPRVVYGVGRGTVLLRGSGRGDVGPSVFAVGVGRAAGTTVAQAAGAYGFPIIGSGVGAVSIRARISGRHELNWTRYDNDLLMAA